MKWVTRHHVKVDRVACPWLIRRFIDSNPEFLFVPPEEVLKVANVQGAVPFDVEGVELGHHGKECSFEAILKKYELTADPALMLLGRIVNGADTDNSLYNQAEGQGLKAIAVGFSLLGLKDDYEILERESIVYDARMPGAKSRLLPNWSARGPGHRWIMMAGVFARGWKGH